MKSRPAKGAPRKKGTRKVRTASWQHMVAGWMGPVPPPSEATLQEESRTRAGFLAGGLGLFLAMLMLRATWLMAIPDSDLEARGRGQYQTAIEMKGERGSIYDRNHRELAATVYLPTLYGNPARMPEAELQKRVADIAKVVGRSEEWVLSQFERRTPDGRKLQEVRLGDSLEPVTARALVSGLSREVMWLKEEPVRLYPGKELAAPLIGYTDASGMGAAGLERVLEKELAGDTYRVMLQHDRKGRAVQPGRDEQRLARQGHSVQLTIDASIQHATEEALWRVMVSSAPESAMAVVMDIETGAILAMASVPSANPNDGHAREQQVLFKNHAAMDQVEPGSVFKPFVVAAALEEGLVQPDTLIDCELGRWFIGGRTIKDDHPKGVISVSEVIKFSSNIGTAKVAGMLGAERTLTYLKNFGFARPTGLGLPGEVAGLMRSPATIKPLELATTSFGQGVTASPVQLLAGISALANGGIRMMPMVVQAILDRHGEVESWYEPRVDRRIVSEETARITNAMMETVIEEGGTGTRAKVPGYRVAGKTGTAQKVENGVYSETKRVSSFIGFLPADRPEVAIGVLVDSPTVGSKYGGLVAAPVFSEIGSFTMNYLGVPPDPPAEPVTPRKEVAWTAPAPVEVTPSGDGAWILPDLTGRSLRNALTALQPTGVALTLSGQGKVIGQSPSPGTRIAPGDAVYLSLN